MATKAETYYYAIGRRKTASATVRLYRVAGESQVNGEAFAKFFPTNVQMVSLNKVFTTAQLEPKDYSFTVKVKGSGKASQLSAIKLGLARAMVKMDPALKKPLKTAGLMTRDPRMVERKKPGLHKARKAEQFSKR
jgi:small subunit ribosomal protein S9